MSFQARRPITEFYLEMRAESLKPEYLFFSAFLNTKLSEGATGLIHVLVSDLYSAYKSFANEMMESGASYRLLHSTSFARQVTKMAIPSSIMVRNVRVWPVNLTELQDMLSRNSMLDKDAQLVVGTSPKIVLPGD